jgi:hypothetical protein
MKRIIFNKTTLLKLPILLKNSYIHFNFCTINKIKEEIVMKKENYNNPISEDLPDNKITTNNYMEEYQSKDIQIYYNLLSKNKKLSVPYTDDDYYSELFDFSKRIVNNQDLESWEIIEKYVKLNLEILDRNFLTEIIDQYATIKYYKFEFWYLAEKEIIKTIKQFDNSQLSNIIYSFGYAEKGSNYFFRIMSEEVLNRGIRNFSEKEFVMIYNGFKLNKINDKLLWAILNSAKKELYPNIALENK